MTSNEMPFKPIPSLDERIQLSQRWGTERVMETIEQIEFHSKDGRGLLIMLEPTAERVEKMLAARYAPDLVTVEPFEVVGIRDHPPMVTVPVPLESRTVKPFPLDGWTVGETEVGPNFIGIDASEVTWWDRVKIWARGWA